MSNVTIDGDAQLASDGVLQGWCWNPNRPAERLVVEILINERIVSAFVASRFREDLPGRNIGDGYYGFITTIAKSLLDAGDDFVISARERSSAYCFWRQVRGESGLPNDFVSRFAEARQRLSRVAQSSHLRAQGGPSLTSRISTELSALGMHLRMAARLDDTRHPAPIARARTTLLQQTAPRKLEIFRNPKIAVIIIADSTSSEVLSTISAIVPTLNSLEASLLLIDRGSNSDVALAPSLFGNLRYVFDPRGDLGSLLADVLKYSQGDLLILMRNPREDIVRVLPGIEVQLNGSSSVHINARSLEIARGICAESSESTSGRPAPPPICLQLAGKRELFERLNAVLSSKDRVTGLDDVDLAIRAIRDGIELCVWDEASLDCKSGLGVEATH
jgi:hypothetical protein